MGQLATLAAHDYLARLPGLDKAQKRALKSGTFHGIELVDSVTRLCAMNMLLHGIGGESDTTDLPVVTKDALAGKHGEYDLVLANPPFGKKSSVTVTNEEGEVSKESLVINRDDFWATIFLGYPTRAETVQLLESTGINALASSLGLSVTPDDIVWQHGGMRALETLLTRLTVERCRREARVEARRPEDGAGETLELWPS